MDPQSLVRARTSSLSNLASPLITSAQATLQMNHSARPVSQRMVLGTLPRLKTPCMAHAKEFMINQRRSPRLYQAGQTAPPLIKKISRRSSIENCSALAQIKMKHKHKQGTENCLFHRKHLVLRLATKDMLTRWCHMNLKTLIAPLKLVRLLTLLCSSLTRPRPPPSCTWVPIHLKPLQIIFECS